MSNQMNTLIAAGGDGPVILLDHTSFARKAFGGGENIDAVALMAALSQANLLLQPEGHWVSLLELVQVCTPDLSKIYIKNPAPLTVLRALFESPEIGAAINRMLQSVRSAAGSEMALVLHLSSPADWITAAGAIPDAEIDDLDAEDIAVFQTNMLQRLDLDGFAAISVDCNYPIAGDLAAAYEPLANFCAHQELDFISIGEDSSSQTWANFQFPPHTWINTQPKSGVLFLKAPEGCEPEFVLLRIKTIREAI